MWGKGEQGRGMGNAGVRAAEYGLGGGDPVAVPLCLILTVTMSRHLTNDKSFRKRTWRVWDSNQELCDSPNLVLRCPHLHASRSSTRRAWALGGRWASHRPAPREELTAERE